MKFSRRARHSTQIASKKRPKVHGCSDNNNEKISGIHIQKKPALRPNLVHNSTIKYRLRSLDMIGRNLCDGC
jgi:hypothetical protein